MDLGLDRVVAFVVGGTGVIGSEVAAQLRAEGATVVIGARSEDALTETAIAIGRDAGEVDTVRIDTADQESVDSAVAAVVEEHGPIGVLVNTAAPSAQTLDPARASDPEQVVEAVEGKAMGYLRVTNAVLPGMVEAGFGRIVQVSGQNSRMTLSVTAATRNVAVTTAAKVLADQVAGSGVSINVVDPGPVLESVSSEVAIGSPGDSTPAQVAALVVFLCSQPAGAISGETVAVGHKLRGFVGY